MFAALRKLVGAEERRAAPRVETTGWFARIDRREFPIANISASGFLVSPYQGDLIKHQKFYLTLVIPADASVPDSKPVEFKVDARVARVGPFGLGAYFLDAHPNVRMAIEVYLQQKLAAQPA